MSDTIRIRPAAATDVAQLIQFISELADYENRSYELVADEASLQQWLFGEDPVAQAVVGELDGEAVGFALFFRSFSTFLGRPGIYLEDLYVTPDQRGRGVGGALLSHLAGICVEHGYGRLDWSVLDWNQPAIRFYENLGAKPQSEWTMYRLTGQALQRVAER